MKSLHLVLYALVIVGAGIMCSAPFVSRFRSASQWLRFGLFLTGLLGITWSTLGFYLLLHEVADKTSLPWSTFWALDHLKSNIAGFETALLLCLILSPEFRSF